MPLPSPDMNSCCKKLCCKNRRGIYDSCDPCQGNGSFNPETCDCEQPGRPYLFVSAFSVNCICSYTSVGWLQYRPLTDAQWFRPRAVTVQESPADRDCTEGYWFTPGLWFTAIWDDDSTYTFGGFGQSYSTDHIQDRGLLQWNWSAVELDSMTPFTNERSCGTD